MNEWGIPLSAGMAVRAEVITDRRKVLSHFFESVAGACAGEFGEAVSSMKIIHN